MASQPFLVSIAGLVIGSFCMGSGDRGTEGQPPTTQGGGQWDRHEPQAGGKGGEACVADWHRQVQGHLRPLRVRRRREQYAGSAPGQI